jgi:hypothetical protein
MDKRYVKQVGFWARMWQGICGLFKKKKAEQSFCKNEIIAKDNKFAIGVKYSYNGKDGIKKAIEDAAFTIENLQLVFPSVDFSKIALNPNAQDSKVTLNLSLHFC